MLPVEAKEGRSTIKAQPGPDCPQNNSETNWHGNSWSRSAPSQCREHLRNWRSKNRSERQRWKHRYKRDYWYAVTEHQEALEAHRPRSIAGNYQSQRSRPREQSRNDRASGQVLNTPLSKTHFSKTSHRNEVQQQQRKVPTPLESRTSGQGRKPICVGWSKPAWIRKETTSKVWRNEPLCTRTEQPRRRTKRRESNTGGMDGGVCHHVADDPPQHP